MKIGFKPIRSLEYQIFCTMLRWTHDHFNSIQTKAFSPFLQDPPIITPPLFRSVCASEVERSQTTLSCFSTTFSRALHQPQQPATTPCNQHWAFHQPLLPALKPATSPCDQHAQARNIFFCQAPHQNKSAKTVLLLNLQKSDPLFFTKKWVTKKSCKTRMY